MFNIEYPTGCTCGPWWSVTPPLLCPVHVAVNPRTPLFVPMTTNGTAPTDPKELAALCRRLADALDPPATAAETTRE